MNCPLCKNTDVNVHHVFTKNTIIDAYKNDPLFSENGEDGVDVTDDLMNIGVDINLYECNECNLRFFEPLLTGTSNFYKKLQKYHWYYKEGGDDKSEFSYIQNIYLKDQSSVLEIGCGDGYFKNYVKGQYVGIDPYSQKSFVIKDTVESYLQRNIQHDIVCAFQTIEHVSDPKSFVQSAVNCISPGGTLVISVPSEDSFLGSVENFSLNLPPHHVTRWSDRALKNITKYFEIDLIEIHHEPMIDYHKLLLTKNLYKKLKPDSIIEFDLGHTAIAVYQKRY
jgi:SAM-dependent methyltransferase